MVADLLSLIYDAEACGLISRLIERVLESAVDPHMAKRDPGNLLQLPAHATPVDAAHDGGKVFVIGLLVKELGKYLLRTLQALRFAALPACGCVRFIEPLDATPRKGTDFYLFAG